MYLTNSCCVFEDLSIKTWQAMSKLTIIMLILQCIDSPSATS